MKYFLFTLCLCAYMHQAHAQGIDFKKLDWTENLAAAQKEKKLIYIDFYTTWCAPCKYMADKFFADEEVGDYYNEHFYSLTIDAEKEGTALAKKYGVKGYPANLFIDPTNEMVIYKAMGSPIENDGFLRNGIIAIDEQKDDLKLSDYENKLANGTTDKKFLLRYLDKLARIDLPNQKPLDEYSKRYFKKNIDSVEIQFMQKYLKTIDNKTFEIFLNNENAYAEYENERGFKKLREKQLVTNLYETDRKAIEKKDEELLNKCLAVAKEHLHPYQKIEVVYYLNWMYFKEHDTLKYLENEYDYAQNLYDIGDEYFVIKDKELLDNILDRLEQQSKTWKGVPQHKIDSLKESKRTNKEVSNRMTMLGSRHLNSQAWNVFETKDKSRYSDALLWAEKAYAMAKQINIDVAAVADTYANLLFVTGKKVQAIKTEQEAIEIAKEIGKDASVYKKTLEKFNE